MARAHGVEELLPYTVKGTEEKIARRQEHGLRVKGTGVGQRVKGKKWERTMKGRLEKRRQAMLEMPKLVQQWKQVRRCIHIDILWEPGANGYSSWAMGLVGRNGQNDGTLGIDLIALGCIGTIPERIYSCSFGVRTT